MCDSLQNNKGGSATLEADMIQTYEAVYEDGVIRLTDDVHLPEHTRVFVIVPEATVVPANRIGSPRLVHPEQAADFVKEVVEEQVSEEGLDAPV